MLDKFFERWAARKNPRFKTYVEGKDAYEAFVQEIGVRFDEMSEEHYRRAQEDPRIRIAEQGFTEAVEMSEKEGELADAAVAKYQLGLVRHVRGELDEAAELMRAALKVMSNLPHWNRAADTSNCHYHLGIIALKQGHLMVAVRELRCARQMDEANTDLWGMQSCDHGLAACADAGADIEGNSDPSSGDSSSWEAPENATENAANEGTPIELEIKSGPIYYDQRELIWLASYSVRANDALMAYLNSLGDEFGRPVGVSRVAFGAADAMQRNLLKPELDQHLCAAIIVLERAGLSDIAFQEFAVFCMRRVIAMPDFRLLVLLHDLNIEDLRDLSDRDPFVAALFDATQIAESPSLEQLRRTLVPYVQQVERIQAEAQWRDLRLRFASMCGNLATVILIAAALLSLLGFTAWLLNSKLTWLGPHGPYIASLVLGMLAFPLQAPLIFLLLRGMRAMTIAPRDNVSLRRWIVVGYVIMFGANLFQHALSGPYSWLFLGLAIGILLDSIRRGGQQAKRQMIDLEALMKLATDPAMRNPKATVLRDDPLNPFSCPLLPALSARVFISYSRSSTKGSRLAAALHRGLKRAGALPFLDCASIPVGASWRRDLNRHLCECDTFLCILDEKSVQREWVAAELLAAIEAHKLTGAPEIVILIDPAIQFPSQSMLPVFHGVVSAATEPPIPGRPQILPINEQTQSALVWGLAPGRFMPTSVFTRVTAIPIMSAMIVPGLIGGLGIIAGFILGFLAMLEKMARFPLTSGLADWDLLEPMTLLSAFWLGCWARATIGLEYERDHVPEIIPIPAIATLGLITALLVFVPKSSALVAGWSVVLVVAGWIMAASSMRIGMKE